MKQEMRKKKKKVVGVTWRTKGNMKKKEGGGGKCHFGTKFENCKSEKYSNTSVQTGKMDSTILQV